MENAVSHAPVCAQEPAVKIRDNTLDILKGIGIILMVLGHSGVAFSNFIYLFHMALFFMASGYVWNDKKVEDLPTLGKSVLSRMKSLWLPYTLANGAFSLLNNVFVAMGIYSPEQHMTLPQIAVNFFKNLLLAGDTRMGGASWFLRCLFFISIGHLVLRYIVVRCKFGKVLFGAVVVVVLVGAEVINRTGFQLPMGISACFGGYTAFLLGMAIRKLDLHKRLGKYLLLVSAAALVVLLILDPIDNIGLGIGNISSLPFFLVASLSGWFLVWGIASLIKGTVARFFVYCGKYSVWVVLLHFIAFKPVAWIYLLATGGEMTGLSDFPVHGAPGLWIAYGVVGTILPLLVCFAVQKVRACIKKNK